MTETSLTSLDVAFLLERGFETSGVWKVEGEKLYCDGRVPSLPGVYAFSIGSVVMYVGVAANSLQKRMYLYANPGSGQSTNIRLKALLIAAERTAPVSISTACPANLEWNGLPVRGPEGLEAGIIKSYDLPWNKRGSPMSTAVVSVGAPLERQTSFVSRVESLIRQRPRLTEAEIALALFGRGGKQQQVNPICRSLVASRRIRRVGTGGPGDPFTYLPG